MEFARTKWCVLSGFLASCLAVCVEWCDMFVERFGVGLFAFFLFVILLNLSFHLLFNIIGSSPAWFVSKKKC